MSQSINASGRFGTLPVFLTAISTILGAVMFLRFGFAVGNLGFFNTALLIILGHMVTIPTALAIAEIATNQKVEGGGEYYIISRSFGINIGSSIGIALFMSQAISVAFYIIALGEAFEPVISWVYQEHNILLEKKWISLAAMALLAIVILVKGADVGMATLYVVVFVLFISIVFFFLGKSNQATSSNLLITLNGTVDNPMPFFYVFAICFPAFTGMTAGVGLSGDLKDPKKSIPLGTLAATLLGMVTYIFITYKLATSASPESLSNNQFVMSDIALWGPIIPIGLAAATISSALGSILVAPRTLQALGSDSIFPSLGINSFLRKSKGKNNEPFNAYLVVIAIAFFFILIGDVNFVAEIITMFFMVTYGSLCLISFLHHFNADPSYRPSFRSRWIISLFGAIICIVLMFQINFKYASFAFLAMFAIYFTISAYRKDRGGISLIFQGAIFQLSRNLQVYLQKADKVEESWRPSIICVDKNSFKRFNAFQLLKWISHRYGFGTYIHQIEDYYSKKTTQEANEILENLIQMADESNVYIDTIISPSYTSAIAQAIQLPGISGKENNMVLFEYAKGDVNSLQSIIENYQLVRAGDFDVCILSTSERGFGLLRNLHIWIKPNDYENGNLMILLGYIVAGHPDWINAVIKVFAVFPKDTMQEEQERLKRTIVEGRLPISIKNVEVLELETNRKIKDLMLDKSSRACLTVMGFRSESLHHEGVKYFQGYDDMGTILFVNSSGFKEIN